MSTNQTTTEKTGLSKKLEDEILKTVFFLTDLLKDPIKTKEYAQLDSNSITIESVRIIPWGDLSLSHGYPGICFVFGELDKLYPNQGWDIVGLNYMKEIQDVLGSISNINLSLWGGIGGIALGADSLSRQGTRYNNFINNINLFFLDNYKSILKISESNITKGVSMADYDVIQGWSGIARYVLHFNQVPQMNKALIDILKYLIKMTEDKQIYNVYVPGWYIPSANLLLESDKFQYPKGTFNCGLAHGIPGVLAILSLAKQNGINVEGLDNAINRIANWLMKWKIENEKDNDIYWPGIISWEEHIENRLIENTPHRDAWCYGSPGVARSLWLAGKAMKQPEWKEVALKSYIATFRREEAHWNIDSPTFCHGMAGLLFQTQCMWLETKDENLKELRDKLIHKILDMFDESAPFGYYDLDNENGEWKSVTKVGLLEGVTGIILALLSTTQLNIPEWGEVFLLN